MKLENTVYSNHKLVIGEFDIPVAVQVDNEIEFRLYDKVIVKADCSSKREFSFYSTIIQQPIDKFQNS